MKIDRVTLTGADESVRPAELVEISQQYPFVEWGILFSRSQQGTARFPSLNWLQKLDDVAHGQNLNLCAHLCGQAVRDLVMNARFTWLDEYRFLGPLLQRMQLNFHAQRHTPHNEFLDRLKDAPWQFIFQMDAVNEVLLREAIKREVNAVPLFDLSGGAGIVPKRWPDSLPGIYCGYAGGLGPTNLPAELERINIAASGQTIWIDMETHIRSNADQTFDLDKAVKCLELSLPWVDLANRFCEQGGL